MNFIKFLSFCLLLCSLNTKAKNIYVNDNSQSGDVFTYSVGLVGNNGLTKSTPKLTLTAALAIAAANDSIYIDAGTYNNEVSLNLTINGVKIVGAGYNATIIDNLYSGLATNYFLYINANNVTLKDLKVTGYENNGTQTPGHSGQAITIGGGLSSITGVLIENVSAILNGQSGGNPAISVLANTTATITGGGSFCNTAGTAYTGGVEAYGKNINLLITDYLLGNNYKVGSFDGGGLRIEGDATTLVTVKRTLISKNIASQGGGISVINGDLKMYDCVIDANSAGQVSSNIYGGGVYISAGNVSFSRCYFKNNFQASGTLRGGAISARYFNTGAFTTNKIINTTIDSCVFQNNSPGAAGMDIYGASGFGNACNITARDCQFLTAGNFNIFSDATSPATSINVTYFGTLPTSSGSNVTRTLSSNTLYTPPSLVPEYSGNCPNIFIGPCTPTVSILSVSSPTICIGNSLVITPTATPQSASTYTLTSATETLTTFPFIVSPTATTTYTLSGTSSGGCISANVPTTTIFVNALPTVSISSSSSLTCESPSVALSSYGGGTYIWSGPGITSGGTTATPTVNLPGTYNLTVTAANGCTATASTSITQNTTVPTATLTPSSLTTTCGSPTATLLVTSSAGPNSVYTWTAPASGSLNNTNSNNPVASGAGVFTVSVTNTVNGCVSSIQTVTITSDVNTPLLNASSSNSMICSGATSTLSVTGADTYTWSSGAGSVNTSTAIVNPTVTTTYSVIGTNTLTGCSNVTNITITANTTPTIGVSSNFNSICLGNNAIINMTGASSYTVTNPSVVTSNSVVVTPTTLTTYTVVGETANCISTTQTISIDVNSLPTLNATATNTLICSNQTVTLSITGADSYTWSTTETASTITVTPNQTTTYTATGTNTTTGCSNITNITVSVTPTPTIGVSASNTTICEGNSTTLTMTGGTSYTVTSPSQTTTNTIVLTPTVQTTYTITGEQQGCASTTETITIDVNTLPTIAASNATTCAGSPVTLTANGADTYTWSTTSTTNTTTVSPISNTTYTVTGTNTLTGCASIPTTVDVITNALPIVIASSNPNTTCTSGTINLTAITTATSYTWTTGNGINNTNQNQLNPSFPASTLTPGIYTYTVQVTDANGCLSPQATTTVSVIDLPNANFDLSDLSICQNENGTISINTPQSNVTYDWSINGQTITNTNPLTVPSIVTGVAGTYTVSVLASLGTCTNTAANTLTVNTLPTVALINSQVSACENTTVQLDVSAPNANYTYNWTNGSNTSTGANLTVNPLTQVTQGTYTVTVTDNNGCTNRTTGKIDLILCETFVPEFFSPNGDGVNDGFVIKNIENYPNNKLKIFNRWGNLVYQKDGYLNEFVGYANVGDAAGKEKLPAGTYYVILVYGDDKTETYNGYLLLQY